MTLQLGPAPPWTDLVFHVLAHVTGPQRFPSSLNDARYRAFCERHLGPATARSLGEDAAQLSQILTSHELLAQLQWVAFLFEDARDARSAGTRELRELRAEGAGTNQALRALSGVDAPAEILRAAAELEAAYHARLPETPVDEAALSHWLARAASAAPRLNTSMVKYSRALTRHGRAVAPVIYVGVPSAELGVEASQIAVQAAHEATVVEVAAHGPLSERDVEHVALVVFAERAERTALRDEHGRWWAALGLPAVAEVRECLPDAGRRVLEANARR